MTRSDITKRLLELAAGYPDALRARQLQDVPRIAFHLALLLGCVPAGRVADVGGGVGMFSLGAEALGLQAVLVDDFRDEVPGAQAALEQHRQAGVEVVSRDVIADGVEFAPGSLDAVTSFDSMEHWHHSPRKLFGQLMTALKPGGWFILGVPNAVNLRKRITVPLGRGKWSGMQEWYDAPVFRGHVREPDVSDLRYIGRDLKLTDLKIIGRNWQGRFSSNVLVRALAAVFDLPLRICPSLCSDLYLVGRKGEG
jgi:SAM-dependent methyltransferase